MAMRLEDRKNITLRAVSERAHTIFICLLFLRGVFVDTLGNLFGLFGLQTSPVSILYYLCMWICLALALYCIVPACLKNLKLLLFVLLSAVLIVFNIVLFPEAKNYVYTNLSRDIQTFQPTQLACSMLAVFIGASCMDFEHLTKALARTAKIGIALALLRTILKLFVTSNQTYDDMNFAYEVAALLCILGASMVFKKTRYTMPFVVAGFMILLISGTRGPLLTSLLLLTLSYILSGNSIKKTAIVLSAAVVLFLLVSLGIVNQLAQAAADAAAEYDIDLRIADMILDGSIAEGSGRAEIQQQYLQAIYNNLLLGNGIGMDRILFEAYPHNILIEILYNFGIPLGGAGILAFSVLIIKTIAKSSGGLRIITLSLLCASVVKLMFSQSYLTSINFFLLIGVMLNLKASEQTQSGNRLPPKTVCRKEQNNGREDSVTAAPQRDGSYEFD